MKGLRTVVFGGLLALTAFLSDEQMQTFIGEHWPWIGSFLGAAIIALRAITSSPIFQKSAPPPPIKPSGPIQTPWLVGLLLLMLTLAGCQGFSAERTLLTACQVHDGALRAVAPLMAAGKLSQGQVGAVFESERVSLAICDGTVRDYRSALTVLEAEALRLAVMKASTEN